jgi:hypothetical protein
VPAAAAVLIGQIAWSILFAWSPVRHVTPAWRYYVVVAAAATLAAGGYDGVESAVAVGQSPPQQADTAPRATLGEEHRETGSRGAVFDDLR